MISAEQAAHDFNKWLGQQHAQREALGEKFKPKFTKLEAQVDQFRITYYQGLSHLEIPEVSEIVAVIRKKRATKAAATRKKNREKREKAKKRAEAKAAKVARAEAKAAKKAYEAEQAARQTTLL
jgi:di/tripeptidase